jgi:hypothetical protein
MTDGPEESRLERAAGALVALAASAAYGLTFGFTYGVNNQTAYMLGGLRLFDPSVLANDWYAAHTLNYHPAFAYLAWLLLAIGGRGGWGVGVATVVAAGAGAACLYWLCRRLLPRATALPTFLLLLVAMMATGTRELASTYVFDPIFQPSTVGSVMLLASLAPFVSGRWLLSGVLLALGGLFHANYLVLGIAVFGIAHLVLGVRDLRELRDRALRQLGPSVLVLLLLSPVILRATGGPDAARAQQILFEIRSPHHYNPRGYVTDFFPFFVWQPLGLAAGGWILRRAGVRGRRFAAILCGMVAIVWLGTLFSVVFDSRRATQLFVWRFAPYIDLLMQLLVAAAVVHALLVPTARPRWSPPQVALVLASAVAVAVAYVKVPPVVGWLQLATLIAAAGVLMRLALPRVRDALSRVPAWVAPQVPRAAAVAAAALFIHQVHGPIDGVRARSNLYTGMRSPETDLYDWLRANTPKDAQILSPPGLERFRLTSERPIVVDWKGSTYAPSELVEWYRRLEDVSGRRGPRSREEVNEGYEALDRGRLDALKGKYGLSYAVVTRSRAAALGQPVVYENPQFAVLDLR